MNDLRDITEQLRSGFGGLVPPVCDEAAGNIQQLRTELASALANVATLRRLLALAYSAPGALYTDDGELQNNETSPAIDFVRDSVSEIERKISERGCRELVEFDLKRDKLIYGFCFWRFDESGKKIRVDPMTVMVQCDRPGKYSYHVKGESWVLHGESR